MKGVSELLSEMTKKFEAQGMSNPKSEAKALLCDVLGCSQVQLYDLQDRLLTEKELITCQLWMQRRLEGEPLAYLSGQVQFYHCLFEITPAVLIPRPETEILVDKVIACLKSQAWQEKILWDVCCGSGCMGIAIKKALPSLSVYLSDQSAEAIALAMHNARLNEVDVICLHGDLLAPFKGLQAHYVVCNPPYISEEEYQNLDREVKHYEPRQALVAGETGLEFYRRLSNELPAYLYPHGQVWLEIGYRQGEAVQQIFQKPPWKKQKVENDWAGHNRFFFLENE